MDLKCRINTHCGQPSNVDTVNKANIPISTLSKLKSLFSQMRSLTMGWFISPSLYTTNVPLKLDACKSFNKQRDKKLSRALCRVKKTPLTCTHLECVWLRQCSCRICPITANTEKLHCYKHSLDTLYISAEGVKILSCWKCEHEPWKAALQYTQTWTGGGLWQLRCYRWCGSPQTRTAPHSVNI